MRARTGHLPSYAEAKKVKLPTLHIYCCLITTSSRDSSVFLFKVPLLFPAHWTRYGLHMDLTGHRVVLWACRVAHRFLQLSLTLLERCKLVEV